MEAVSDSNSVSEEAGKSISVQVFPQIKELGDANGKPESHPFPPFFMQLPTELKLKIFYYISTVAIAKVSCVCSELRYLVSSDDVWEQKYVAQFGNCNGLSSEGSFKERFVRAWEGRKSGSGKSCLINMMRRNFFDPFGCGDLRGDDEEWLDIVRLCQPRIGVPQLRNGMADVSVDFKNR